MAFNGMTAEIPMGTGGFNANKNLTQVEITELIQSENTSYAFGTLQKEGGSALYTSAPVAGGSVILAGRDWWPTALVQRSVIVASNKHVYKDSGAGTYSTDLGLLANNIDTVPIFVEGGKERAALPKKLFIYTGGNQLQVLSGDGLTLTPVKAPPADWTTVFPIGGCIHLNRHFGFGGINSHWLYGSDFLDHEDFGGAKTDIGTITNGSKNITATTPNPNWKVGDIVTSPSGFIPVGNTIQSIVGTTVTMAGANATGTVTETITAVNPSAVNLPVYPGQGDGIAAIFSFKGKLIVGKYPRGIYYVDMTDPDVTKWFTVPVSLEVGFAGPRCWCPVDDDILFMDAQGAIHMLSSVLEFGDYGLQSISDQHWLNNYINDNVAKTFIPQVQAIFYPSKREAHFALTGIGKTTNSLRLVLDFNIMQKVRARYATKDALVSTWLARDPSLTLKLTGGDALGQVWTLDQAVKSVNNVGYNSYFQTSYLDFSNVNPVLGGKRKNYKFLEMVGEPAGFWAVTIDVYIDGNYSQTIPFNFGTTGSALGSFTLGTSAFGASTIASVRRRMTGSGKRVTLIGNSPGANQDFSISRMTFYFKPGGESSDH